MTQTLYRKYRPQKFSDVVGQEHVTKILQNQIKSGNIAHAYLFSGPRGIGKTTTARLLAKAANAHHSDSGEPNNEASINQSISQGRSLDLVEIDAASNRRIEEIRELRDHVKYPPNEGKYKVFIIDEVHMLTPEAFNALLKTLEEPPDFVIFILATTELHKLPETIISRCQRFDFKKVNPQILETRLREIAQAEGVVVADSVLKTIVKLSEGCVRDAEGFLGQVLSLGEKNITQSQAELFLPKSNVLWLDKLWQSLVAKNLQSGVEVIQEMNSADIEVEYFYNDWLELLRLILIWKINSDSAEPVYVVSSEVADNIKNTLKEISLSDIRMIIDIFIFYKKYITVSPLPQLALELGFAAAFDKLQKTEKPTDDSDDSDSDKGDGGYLQNSNERKEIKNNPKNTKSKVSPKKTQADPDDAEIKKMWQKVLENISKSAPGLHHYLKSAQIRKSGKNLEIVAGHFFHHEILKKDNHLKKIADEIMKIFQQEISFRVLLEEGESKKTNPESPLADFIDVFGGRILEEAGEE